MSAEIVSEPKANRPQGETADSPISPAHSPAEGMEGLTLPKKDEKWGLAVAEERSGSIGWSRSLEKTVRFLLLFKGSQI